MACRRTKVLLNDVERGVLNQLRALVHRHGAEVWPKVSFKDAVDINNSGISEELFSYAMRAHLDYVVTDGKSSRVLFAVEYDGADHFKRPATIERDRKKSEVCRTLAFDLLRITKCQLEGIFLNSNQLELLVERWFEEYERARESPTLAIRKPPSNAQYIRDISRPGSTNNTAAG